MSAITPELLFRELNGSMNSGFAVIDSPVHRTPGGVLYLVKPGVVLLSRPNVNPGGLVGFLGGFAESLNFPAYLQDPTALPDGAQLCKIAGQVCYMSFGRGRTFNAQADRYFNNLKSSGHGSVFEHANFSFLLYGVSRSVTHEIVRHRAGFGYCLTGDTLIYSTHQLQGKPDGTKKRRLEDLYEMTQSPHGRSRIKLLRLRCLDETTGTFVGGKVKSIIRSGLKPVFTVKLADGKTITSTKEHRFLTKEGWVTLEDAVGGLEITANGTVIYRKTNVELMVNGRPIYQDAEWLREHYMTKGLPQESIAELAGASPHTIRTWIRKHGLQKPLGSWTVGKAPWNKGLHYRAQPKSDAEKAAARERMKGAGNHRWRGGISRIGVALRREIKQIRPSIYARDHQRCRLCGNRGGKLTIHHVLPIWARPDLACDPENMVTLCRTCHIKVNNHEEDFVEVFGRTVEELGDAQPPVLRPRKPWLVPKPVHIVEISFASEQMTYDIEMEEPYHNFVANGIITHNSQLSQRYVSGRMLRFVERPEYSEDEQFHEQFLERIERASSEYAALTNRLLEMQQAGTKILSAEERTDLRKKVQQCARSVLPNETEAPIVVTGNARAWRHFIEMRASAHAEIEIRELAVRVFLCLHLADPVLFGDYTLEQLPDGTYTAITEFEKV
jgi:thymidylate synthase ThyX